MAEKSNPNPVSDRYRRYKAGTIKITKWLRTAAKKCTNLNDALSALCVSKESPTVALTSQDLVRLAEAIAQATSPKIDIPLEIIVITEDVIQGREACADWFDNSPTGASGDLEASNRGHRNFVEVLKRVLAILKTKYEERLPKLFKKKPEKIEQAKIEVLENIYQHLDLQEPAANPLGDVTNLEKKPFKTKSGASLLLPTEAQEADKTFALWCFFKDQHDTNGLLRTLWEEYRDGKLSLPVVCQVTDFAFMLMKRADTALTTQYPEFNDQFGFDEHLGFDSWLHDKLLVLTFRKRAVNTDGRSTPAVHELFCTTAAAIMQDFREKADKLPNDYDRCAIPTTIFGPALHSIVDGIILLVLEDRANKDDSTYLPLVGSDTFLAGLKDAVINGKTPLWLLTACQAHIEIYDVMGMHFWEGHETLHKEAPRLQRTLQDHKQFVTSLKAFDHSRLHEKTMLTGIEFQLRTLHCEVDIDIIQELHKETPIDDLKNPSPGAFWMQKQLPVKCGSMLFLSQQCCHVFGLLSGNFGLLMLATAHLYKAMRLGGALSSEWPDMEWYIEQHSKRSPFVLAPKVSSGRLTALAKHYLIALGAKPSAGLAFRRYTRTNSEVPPVLYAEPPTYRQSFKQGCLLTANNLSPYLQHMNEETSQNKAYRQGRSCWTDLQELVLHKVASTTLNKGRVDASKTSDNATKLTAVDLLGAFKDMLKEHELNFNFDYGRFLRRCSNLLTKLTTKFGAVGYDASSAYGFLNIMLWEAASTEKAPTSRVRLQDTMIYQGASIVQELIEQEGGIELDEARPRCSKHLPKPQRKAQPHGKDLLGLRPTVESVVSQSLDVVLPLQEIARRNGGDVTFDPLNNTVAVYLPSAKSRAEVR